MITTFIYQHSPRLIKSRIKDEKGFKKILGNINWLMFEKVILTGLTFVIGVFVVRYLGPQKFGQYSYVQSFIGIFMPIATLGLDNIVIRELVKKKEQKDEILGSTFLLKLTGSGLLVILSIVASLFINADNLTTTLFVLILAIGQLFKSFDAIDYWFRSQVESQYSALARLLAVLIVSTLQILLVVLQGPLLGLIIISSLHFVLDAVFYLYFYQRKVGSILTWTYKKQIAKELLSSSWPIILAGFATAIYMKVDQLIINSALGEAELGYYSSAVKISQAVYFIPTIISTAIYPAIINAKKKNEELYKKRLKILYTLFLWGSIMISLVVSLLSKPIIYLTFGDDFSLAAKPLSVHIWAFVFVCLGVVSAKELLTEDKLSFLLIRTIIGAATSVLANILLIPHLGIVGAAGSAVIAQASSNFISPLLFKDTRKIFLKFLKAFNIFELIN